MNIEEYLNSETFTSKQELMEITNLSERAVRNCISDLKLRVPVIYNSQQKGHRLAKNVEDLQTIHDIEKEYEAVQHCINDIEARKKVFNKQERIYIKYLKELEQKFLQVLFL